MNNSIAENLAAVQRRIVAAAERAGRSAADVTLVTVTKNFPVDRVVAAVAAGATALGENRAREAADKYAALGNIVNGRHVAWHFIGHLQTNKVKLVNGWVDLIHSVDSIELARAIDRRARAVDRVQAVLLELNIAGESAKAGAKLSDVPALAQAAAELPNIAVKGLMTMAPLVDDPADARPVFAALRDWRDKLKSGVLPDCDELSMGMTDDFEVAVEEGATIVRVGRAIMGPRPLA